MFIQNFTKIRKIEFFIYSVFSGMLLGFGWPTDGNPIYLFIAFIPLLYVENCSNHSILLFSFITFLVWNAISTWWLSYARRTDGTFAIEAYLIPILLNSLFMSIIFSFYSWIKKHVKSKKIGYVFLVCLWILFEKMHLEWELSWPWLNLGNGFANRTEWIQWYEYTGVLGGSIWIWIVNIGLTESILKYKNNKNILFLYEGIFLYIGIIIFMIFISNIIYIKYEKQNQRERNVNVLILQPNIDPYHQKYHISTDELIYKLKNLIDQEISKKSMIIIAPETMFPGKGDKIQTKNINENKVISSFQDYLKNKSPNTVLLIGVELLTTHHKSKNKTSIPIFSKKTKNIQWVDIFNSMIQIGIDRNIQFHHKSKLVPAVETFPYKKIFSPILGNMLLNFGGTVMELGKENSPSIFRHPYLGIKIAPIICYESVFGEYVSNFFKEKDVELIVIITNDGWWGTSQGHKQHMYYARIRAIENRKHIARSANTGISCLINEKGEITSYIPYGKEGVLYDKIYLNKKKTFYIKHGDFIYRISLLTTIIILLYAIIYNMCNKFFFQKKQNIC